MRSLVRLTLSLLALAALSLPAEARGKKKAKPPEYHDTVIAKVSADAITIDQDKVAKTFKITPFTEITLRAQKVAFTDLQPGMIVSVTMAADPAVASRIAAGDPPVHNDSLQLKPRK